MADIIVEDGAPVADKITIYKGSTFSQGWEYGEGVIGAVTPPAGWPGDWDVRCEIREDFGDEYPIYVRFHSDPAELRDGSITLGTITDGPDTFATIVLFLGADVSEAMTWELGKWDLEIAHKTNLSLVHRILKGPAKLDPEVTLDD